MVPAPTTTSRRAMAVSVAGSLLTLSFVTLSQSPPAATPATVTPEQARAYVQSLLVGSPYRMSASARAGEIRYRIAFDIGVSWKMPETGEQHVRSDGDTVEVAVCTDCGREAPPDDATLTRYRTANAWVNSDDPAIRRFVRQHVRAGSLRERMRQLVIAVQRHMTGPIDYRHYDSAATALETRSGDCTEFALLLAAGARRLGIPARLAHGIAYSSRFTGQSHVFSPHVWVQVWDGTRWVSYDAGLGEFDAGHIALWIGDGSPEPLRPLPRMLRGMRIVEAAGIRRAPGATDAGKPITTPEPAPEPR